MKHYVFQIHQLASLKVLSICVRVIVLLSTATAVLQLKNKDNGKRLELVQVLFRHGERTPDDVNYSQFPYVPLSVYEPYGLGLLTKQGMKQSYQLGSVLRKRYANYLDNVYNAEDLHAHSSDHERATTTLQLVLAGLYPPTKKYQWNPLLNWQPIPYIYIPEKLDVLFKAVKSKRYNDIQNREIAGILVAKVNDEYSDIIQHFQNFSKLTPHEKQSFLCHVDHVLHINERMGIPLPKWCTRDILIRLKKYVMFFFDSLSYTPQMRRMNAGPLIKKFVDNMNVNDALYNPRKIYLYSGHDFNIAAVINALGGADYGYPDFSSAIIVEKLRDVEDNRLYVRLVGRQETGEEFKTLKMKNCSELCPMEEFVTIAKEVIPSNEEMHHMEREFRGSLTDNIFFNDPYVKEL